MPKQDEIATNDETNFTGKEVAVNRTGPSGVMIGGKVFAVIQQVNVPTLKHETGETVAVRLMQKINLDESSREIEVTVDGVKTTATQTNEINVIRVTELGSNQLFNLVLNAITASELRSAYPDHSYVNKCFAIKKLGTVAGKRYKDVQIVEIAYADMADAPGNS